MMKISVIIPVYNEESCIAETLRGLQQIREEGHEIILVDAGSTDDTCALAEPLVDQVIHSAKSRALQMNNGASRAKGQYFWFLHADTRVSPGAMKTLQQVLNDENFKWSRFDIRLSGKHILFRIIERMVNFRSCVTAIATGDQGICVERNLFFQTGCYPEIPLMEDIALSTRLKNVKRPVCIHEPLITSSRRWEENGIVKTILLMWRLRFLYWVGISPDKLVKMYK